MFKYTDDNHHLNFQQTSQFVKFHSFQLQCQWHLDMSIWGTGKLWQPIMIIRIKNITGFSPKRRLIQWYRIKLMASVLIGTMFDYFFFFLIYYAFTFFHSLHVTPTHRKLSTLFILYGVFLSVSTNSLSSLDVFIFINQY